MAVRLARAMLGTATQIQPGELRNRSQTLQYRVSIAVLAPVLQPNKALQARQAQLAMGMKTIAEFHMCGCSKLHSGTTALAHVHFFCQHTAASLNFAYSQHRGWTFMFQPCWQAILLHTISQTACLYAAHRTEYIALLPNPIGKPLHTMSGSIDKMVAV